MNDARLEAFCKLGTQADQHTRAHRHRDALKSYQNILTEVEKSGELDSYLLAKVTLGALRAHVKIGDFQQAIEIWNAHMDESLWGIGIYALENAQTKIEDLVLYDMLCAFLHTLVEGDRRESIKAVNLYMSRVCEHAFEAGDKPLIVQAISNWKSHLKEICGGSIPMGDAKNLIQFEKRFGEVVKPRSIDFPLPAEWEKPGDFRETSTVVAKRALVERMESKKKKRA